MAQADKPTQEPSNERQNDRYQGKVFRKPIPDIGLNTLQIRAMLDAVIYNQAMIMAKLAGKENDDQTIISFIDDTYDQIEGNLDELLKRYLEPNRSADQQDDNG